jgi:hypothetical protein
LSRCHAAATISDGSDSGNDLFFLGFCWEFWMQWNVNLMIVWSLTRYYWLNWGIDISRLQIANWNLKKLGRPCEWILGWFLWENDFKAIKWPLADLISGNWRLVWMRQSFLFIGFVLIAFALLGLEASIKFEKEFKSSQKLRKRDGVKVTARNYQIILDIQILT